jgi:hypothetical protein
VAGTALLDPLKLCETVSEQQLSSEQALLVFGLEKAQQQILAAAQS